MCVFCQFRSFIHLNKCTANHLPWTFKSLQVIGGWSLWKTCRLLALNGTWLASPGLVNNTWNLLKRILTYFLHISIFADSKQDAKLYFALDMKHLSEARQKAKRELERNYSKMRNNIVSKHFNRWRQLKGEKVSF